MRNLSARICRCRNIVAGEVFNLVYTAKANILADNCIFIHIPQNAGTSITEAFNLPASNHYTAKELQWWMGRRCFNRFFSFCIIRNPYDRLVSLYHNTRLERSQPHAILADDHLREHTDYELLKDASLDQCADLLLEGKLSKLWNPQTDWFLDDNGEILVTYVGHYETLDQDFIFLTQQIQGAMRQFPIMNSSHRRIAYSGELTDYARAAANHFYRRDFATFAYQQ